MDKLNAENEAKIIAEREQFIAQVRPAIQDILDNGWDDVEIVNALCRLVGLTWHIGATAGIQQAIALLTKGSL